MKTMLLVQLKIPKTGEHQTRISQGWQYPKEEEEDDIGGISTKSVWTGGRKIWGDAEFERPKKRSA